MSSDRAGDNLVRAANEALNTDVNAPAVEFAKHWYSFGNLKSVADRVAGLLKQTGAEPNAPIAFAPRNRPSAVATLLGLIADRRSVQMLYAYQSGSALARNFARLDASAPSRLASVLRSLVPGQVAATCRLPLRARLTRRVWRGTARSADCRRKPILISSGRLISAASAL